MIYHCRTCRICSLKVSVKFAIVLWIFLVCFRYNNDVKFRRDLRGRINRTILQSRRKGPAHLYQVHNVTDSPRPTDNSTKVIIIAYYRGGSSFLAQLFNHNPVVNYYHEPFKHFFRDYKRRNAIPVMSDVFVDVNKGKMRQFSDEVKLFLQQAPVDLLRCELSDLPSILFHHAFFATKVTPPVLGAHISGFSSCIHYSPTRAPNETLTQHYLATLDHYSLTLPRCIHFLEDACRKRPVRAFMTSHMTLEHAHRVLTRDPSVRLVYSFRDPLGLINSRHQVLIRSGVTSLTSKEHFRRSVSEMCIRLRNDLSVLSKIQRDFPKSIYVTTYDKMFSDVIRTAFDVCRYLDLDLPEEVIRWVGAQVKRAENTRRNRKRKQNVRWELSQEQINITRELCADVMDIIL